MSTKIIQVIVIKFCFIFACSSCIFCTLGFGIFQKACEYGLDEHVKELLSGDCNPNATSRTVSSPGILLSAYKGYYKIIELLKEHKTEAVKNGKYLRINTCVPTYLNI